MNPRGLTLVELIIVIAIFSIITSATVLSFSSFLTNNQLNNHSNQLIQSLRKAQSNATQRLENSQWGVYVDDDASPSFTFFKGSSYAGRDNTFDEFFDLPSALSYGTVSITGGGNEIIFNKITGETSATGSVSLTDNQNTITISINELGQIDDN